MSKHRIQDHIAAARGALGYEEHVPIGLHEPTWSRSKPAAVSSLLNLGGTFLPSLFNNEGEVVRDPRYTNSAVTAMLPTAILAGSRVCQAGAHLLVRPDQPELVSGTKDVFYRNDSEFRTLSALRFASVADDADVGISTHPVLSAPLDWNLSLSKGVRIEFNRREQKEVGIDLLTDEVIAAIALGLARAADETLLAAIAATTPAAFTLAAAAAQGLRHSELSALVGTAGNGAATDAAGQLRAAGIGAELTADAVGTYVGAFDRSAIAICECVPIHYERINTRGDLVITAWAQLLPLVPDVAKFWTVAG